LGQDSVREHQDWAADTSSRRVSLFSRPVRQTAVADQVTGPNGSHLENGSPPGVGRCDTGGPGHEDAMGLERLAEQHQEAGMAQLEICLEV
jgi:hypothetical protein